MANLSHADARKYVDSIRVNNGGIEDSDRDRTPEAVLEALDSVRKQLAASTEMYLPGHLFSNPSVLLTMPLTDLPQSSTRSPHDLFMSSSKTQRIIATPTPKLQGRFRF